MLNEMLNAAGISTEREILSQRHVNFVRFVFYHKALFNIIQARIAIIIGKQYGVVSCPGCLPIKSSLFISIIIGITLIAISIFIAVILINNSGNKKPEATKTVFVNAVSKQFSELR